MERKDGRLYNEKRETKVTQGYTQNPEGSVLIETGNTKVICTACVEYETARHLKGTGKGWITAEYSMLPGATLSRKKRDRAGKQDGRSVEIQRLIGRALRAVVDLDKLGELTIYIDCDVVQADGGTRTAAVTGGFIAMMSAMKKLKERGDIKEIPVNSYVSAISVGVLEDGIMLDLCYEEDSLAIVDMNVIMTDKGEFIEIQGTGEERPFTAEELSGLLELGRKGCSELHEIQREVLHG